MLPRDANGRVVGGEIQLKLVGIKLQLEPLRWGRRCRLGELAYTSSTYFYYRETRRQSMFLGELACVGSKGA